jgi:flagellar basal-body rod protein FlgB
MADLVELAGPVTALTRAALDAAELRNFVLANNIANANAPGFVPLRVAFEERLQNLWRGDGPPFAAIAEWPRAEVEADQDPVTGIPAQVLVDMEAAKVAQNSVHYQALLKALGVRMDTLTLAVTGGR